MRKLLGLALAVLLLLTTGCAALAEGGEKVVIVANNEGGFSDLDEVNNFAVFNQKFCNTYGDTLFLSDHYGAFEPWIATEWAWDETHTNITLKIREGVTFQCGEPLTAYDVAATYQRIVDEFSNLTNPYRWVKLSGAEALDETTAVLHFSSPMPSFMSCASQIPIIHAADYEANKDTFFNSADFCTSGPFKVTAADFVNTVVEMTRNDNWWAWDENKTNIDKIIYQNITEDTTRVSALRSGEITIAENVPYMDIATIQSEGFVVNSYHKDEHVYLVLNCHEGKAFANKDLREAVSLAIDRGMIASAILGNATASTWPCIPGDFAYVAGNGYAYDTARAAELVANSGYNGEAISMIISAGVLVQGEEVAQAIQAMCSAVGINMKLEIMETAAFNERKMAGSYDVCLSAWTNSMSDAYNELVEILGRTDMFQSGLVNEELFELVDTITVTYDDAEREELQKQAYAIVMEQFGPDLYLYDCTSNLCYNSALTNLVCYNDSVFNFINAQLN